MTNSKRSLYRRTVYSAALACLTVSFAAHAQSGPGKGYSQIPPDAYSVVAEVRAKPGKADELRSVTLPLVPLVRGDPKNLVYLFQEDRESSGHLIFYEVWANQADFEAHNNMPYVKEWFTKLPALADGGVKVTKMRILEKGAK